MPARILQTPSAYGARGAAAPAPEGTRSLVVCQADGQFVSKVNPTEISAIIAHNDQFVWIDLQDPHDAVIALLREEFHFHLLAIEDATKHHERPNVESCDGYSIKLMELRKSIEAEMRAFTQA